MDANQVFAQINAGNNLPIVVPYELTIKGKEYKGELQYRFPNVRDEIMIGLEEAKLRGTLVEVLGKPELITVPYESIDRVTSFLIEGLATLKVLSVIKEAFETLPPELIIEMHRGYLQQKDGSGNEPATVDTSDSGSNTGEVAEPDKPAA